MTGTELKFYFEYKPTLCITMNFDTMGIAEGKYFLCIKISAKKCSLIGLNLFFTHSTTSHSANKFLHPMTNVAKLYTNLV